MRPLKQKTIGLLGGCSNVATGEYYKLLNAKVNERLGDWEIAETLIRGMNFGNVEAFVRSGDWSGLSGYMERGVDALITAGAEVILCVSNTLHKPLESIMAGRQIPFIHIADPTGEAIRAKGLWRVALLGTQPVMQMTYLRDRYQSKFGLDIVVPNPSEQQEIDRIIFDELVKSQISESSRDFYLKIVDRLASEEEAEGVILGCTEIFLLLRQHDRPAFPMFDTTQLHCDAAVDFALQGTRTTP